MRLEIDAAVLTGRQVSYITEGDPEGEWLKIGEYDTPEEAKDAAGIWGRAHPGKPTSILRVVVTVDDYWK